MLLEPYVGSATYRDSRDSGPRTGTRGFEPDEPWPSSRADSSARGISRQLEYPAGARGYPADSRAAYQPQQPAGYGRTSVSSPYALHYGSDPRYASQAPQQPKDGAPPGYVRQGDYYVPISQPVSLPPTRAETLQYPSGSYTQPLRHKPTYPKDPPPEYQPPRYAYPSPATVGEPQDPRIEPRDPRYQTEPQYQDPRYAYPSPAAVTDTRDSGVRPKETSYAPMQDYRDPRYAYPSSYADEYTSTRRASITDIPSALTPMQVVLLSVLRMSADICSSSSSQPYQTDAYGRRE